MHTYDTMSTVMPMPGSEQVPFYENSFRLPGLVYDNVLKAGMKPFVELRHSGRRIFRNLSVFC